MNWYYAKNGAQQGPVTLEDLKSHIAMGELAPTDLAWREGMADWLPVSDIAELKAEAPPARTEAEPSMPAQFPVAPSAPAPAEPYRVPSAAPAPAGPAQMVPGQAPSQGLAIGSMVCGILALVICCVWFLSPVLGLVAIVLGVIAHSKIKSDPARYRGKGMATTGIVTGLLGMIAGLVIASFEVQLIGKSEEEKIEKIIQWTPESSRPQMRKFFEDLKAQQKNQSTPAH